MCLKASSAQIADGRIGGRQERANMSDQPVRFMNFISEQQLDEAREKRGERVDDGSAQRDRPLFEILKENKDKQQAEFNDRFKHRPPKALDEDETQFLEKLEMSKREYEQQLADEEAQQLRKFQAAVASHTTSTYQLKESIAPKPEGWKPAEKKKTQVRPLSSLIKFKPQAKKVKRDMKDSNKEVGFPENLHEVEKMPVEEELKKKKTVTGGAATGLTGLVSYSDESEDGAD